jgi:hypothetical protein
MFTRGVDFNRRAERWAARHGKPVVGNCDVHWLRQLGTTCSLVDAPRSADAICEAIAEGRVRVESRPLAWTEAARVMGAMWFGSIGAGSMEDGFKAEPSRSIRPAQMGLPLLSDENARQGRGRKASVRVCV